VLAPVQILFILDLSTENPIDVEVVKGLLPVEHDERVILRLSEFGARPGARGVPANWDECASAVYQMVMRAREVTAKHDGRVEYFVVGRAALPVFAHLGLELSKWATVTIHETEPSEATGRVAVFVSTTYAAQKDVLRAYVATEGSSVAGVVEVCASNATLDTSNATVVAGELVSVFTRVKATYPHLSGVALFLAGPASLAFLAGRAINLNIIDDVLVPQHDAGAYKPALSLPWRTRTTPLLPQDDQARRERSALLDEAISQIEELRAALEADDLPSWVDERDRERFLETLRELSLLRDAKSDEFELLVAEGRLVFGSGLLEALRPLAAETRHRIIRNVVLHELFHFQQNLHSTTYQGIGRAGFALEEVDYWADAFALRTLSALKLRQNSVDDRNVGTVVEAEILGALRGAEAFDRAQQGAIIRVLSERRLRRYLVWSLQRQRSLTLRTMNDLDELFGERLVVELAPLEGHLDGRHDKVADKASVSSELFVVLQGRLVRAARQSVFDPIALVEAVRRFDHEALIAPMKFIRDQNLAALVPWLRQSQQ
jgi:hypothetical protein